MMVNFSKANFKAKENTGGMKISIIQDNGRITKWKVLENKYKKMKQYMKDILKMEKNMVKVKLNGVMEDHMMEIGKTENKMEKELIKINKETKKKACG